jgi:hypothetical protein
MLGQTLGSAGAPTFGMHLAPEGVAKMKATKQQSEGRWNALTGVDPNRPQITSAFGVEIQNRKNT